MSRTTRYGTVPKTEITERKVQNALRKIKSKLAIQEYKGTYPTGSSPGKCYGTAKIHKFFDGDGIEKLPTCPKFLILTKMFISATIGYLHREKWCCYGFPHRPSACRDIYGELRKVVSP